MAEVPQWFLHIGSMILGSMAAYFGARNAMQERLARLEAIQAAHADDILDMRKRTDYAHERINRLLENAK